MIIGKRDKQKVATLEAEVGEQRPAGAGPRT